MRNLGGLGLRLLGPVFLLPACSDGPYLQTEEFVTENGKEEVYMGGGCVPVQSGSGMGGGTAPVLGHGGEDGEGAERLTPGYSFSYEGTGNSVRFVVTDGDGVVRAERNYDSAFLSEGKQEEISVNVTGGKMRFLHWGNTKCSDTRTPDSE